MRNVICALCAVLVACSPEEPYDCGASIPAAPFASATVGRDEPDAGVMKNEDEGAGSVSKPYDAAPAADEDADGIPDSQDECPSEPPGDYPSLTRPGCPGCPPLPYSERVPPQPSKILSIAPAVLPAGETTRLVITFDGLDAAKMYGFSVANCGGWAAPFDVVKWSAAGSQVALDMRIPDADRFTPPLDKPKECGELVLSFLQGPNVTAPFSFAIAPPRICGAVIGKTSAMAEGVNLLAAIRAAPGASVGAQEYLATMDFRVMFDVVGSGNIPPEPAALGITAEMVMQYAQTLMAMGDPS